MDSLDTVELVMRCEEEFGVTDWTVLCWNRSKLSASFLK